MVLGVVVHKGPKFWNDLRGLSLNWAAAGLCVYFANYFLRAKRLRILSEKRLEIWPDAVHSASLHGVATYFLPIRTGELTLPVILKSVSNIGLKDGAQILVKARFLDFTTLGMWMLGAVSLTNVSVSPRVKILWFLSALAMSILPLATKWLKSWRWFKRQRMYHFFSMFEMVTSISFCEILMSLGIWMAVASCFYCTAQAIGLTIGIGEVIFLITIQLPLQLIPIQGFANSGNHEGGWIAGLVLLGIPTSEAVDFALTSHALLILYVLALGIVALITRMISAKQKAAQ